MSHHSTLITHHPSFAFFGTDEFAVTVLETFWKKGMIPTLIVTTPDKPKGRNLVLTPPPVKIWAKNHDIEILQPDNLKDPEFTYQLKAISYKLFIVASYGKIIPKEIFEMPRYKTLNIHPSLLPKLRGSSPVATAILKNLKNTGVSIMQIDEKMDHGPILAQKEMNISEWPKRSELEQKLANIGAELLVEILPLYTNGTLKPVFQDETLATYSEKLKKEMGEIDLRGDPYEAFLKIQAFDGWPGAFAYFDHAGQKIRVVITEVKFVEGKLEIQKVLPQGKKEMSFEDFKRGLRS